MNNMANKWREETPKDFVFAVKGSRFCTNRKVLAGAGESVFSTLMDKPGKMRGTREGGKDAIDRATGFAVAGCHALPITRWRDCRTR